MKTQPDVYENPNRIPHVCIYPALENTEKRMPALANKLEDLRKKDIKIDYEAYQVMEAIFRTCMMYNPEPNKGFAGYRYFSHTDGLEVVPHGMDRMGEIKDPQDRFSKIIKQLKVNPTGPYGVEEQSLEKFQYLRKVKEQALKKVNDSRENNKIQCGNKVFFNEPDFKEDIDRTEKWAMSKASVNYRSLGSLITTEKQGDQLNLEIHPEKYEFFSEYILLTYAVYRHIFKHEWKKERNPIFDWIAFKLDFDFNNDRYFISNENENKTEFFEKYFNREEIQSNKFKRKSKKYAKSKKYESRIAIPTERLGLIDNNFYNFLITRKLNECIS